ncbi:MAG: hypothetical protein FKY71_13850 [Spiribacter salinus]|uniref:Uncharacterized protein n=1 Tax=Spiribacter salinus TaxID=1335746 RepID=A0A540VNT8_9GAMM|nr:MAG: hypothetical protein FKY71_13850 [Spiribacter salinus]
MTQANEATADRIRSLRQQLLEVQQGLDQRISETQSEIRRIASTGIRQADEVADEVLGSLAKRAERGRSRIEAYIRTAAKPDHYVHELHIGARSRWSLTLNDLLTDPDGDVFAALFEEQLKETLSARIERVCADSTLPGPDERESQIKQLVETLQRLQTERDDVQDEIASAFGGEPSRRTKDRLEAARRQEIADGLNEASAERQGLTWLDQQREKQAARA